jgi:hypothetical protein
MCLIVEEMKGKHPSDRFFSTDVHSALKNLMGQEVLWAFEDTGNHVRKWITNTGGSTNGMNHLNYGYLPFSLGYIT